MTKAMENYLEKRRIIVRAAKALFLKGGYIATSMDKVAMKAGVTKQTVYRYFPSKTDLFKATLESIANNNMKNYTFGDTDLRNELIAFGTAFLRFHMETERLDVIRLLVAEGRVDRELSETFYEAGPKTYAYGSIVPFLKKRMPDLDDAEFFGKLLLEMLLTIRMPVLLGIRGDLSEVELVSHVKNMVDFFIAGCGHLRSKKMQ